MYDAHNLMENVTRVNFVSYAVIQKELLNPITTYLQFRTFVESLFDQLSTFTDFYSLVAKQKIEQEVVDEMLSEIVSQMGIGEEEAVMVEEEEEVVVAEENEVVVVEETEVVETEKLLRDDLEIEKSLEERERDREQEILLQDQFHEHQIMLRERELEGAEMTLRDYGMEEHEVRRQEAQEVQEKEVQETRTETEARILIETEEEDEVLECRKGEWESTCSSCSILTFCS